MGRRSKNKQGDPEPFPDRQTAAPKKLGKRKPEHNDAGRPAKKLKGSLGQRKGKVTKKASIATLPGGRPEGKENVTGSNGKSRAVVVEEKEGAELVWEDVEDDVDLEAEAKCVCFCVYILLSGFNHSTGLFSTPAITKMPNLIFMGSQVTLQTLRWMTTSALVCCDSGTF